MNANEYATMFQVEDRHWWYVGMRHISTLLVALAFPGRDNLRILEAGCGTGAAMGYLAPFGQVTGLDFSPIALQFCQRRGLTRLGQGSVAALPFADNSFDLITSFDVLYHRAVGDYRQVLGQFWRVLRPGGKLLLRLPAYNWLRGRHDTIIHTHHRFTVPELRVALSGRDFTIEKLSYANTLLFPMALAKRLLERLAPLDPNHSDIQANPAWQDSFFARFLLAEATWLKKYTFPFGLTVIALAQKPE